MNHRAALRLSTLAVLFVSAGLDGCYGGADDPTGTATQAIMSCPTTHSLRTSTVTCEYTLQSVNPVGTLSASAEGHACAITCECGFGNSGEEPTCGAGTPADGDYPRACAPFIDPVRGPTMLIASTDLATSQRLCATRAADYHAECGVYCARRAASLAGVAAETPDAVIRREADLFCCVARTRTTTTTRTTAPEAQPSTVDAVRR